MISSHEIDCDWLARWAHYSPSSIAIQDAESNAQWTYLQANQSANTIAHYLQQTYNITSGDRVAVLSHNEPEYVFLFFALQKIGAIMVPVNFRLTAREIEHILKDSGSKLLIHQKSFQAIVDELEAANTCKLPSTLFFEELSSLKTTDTKIQMPRNLEAAAMILYTSGTTGSPKGAIITHQMLYWNSISTGLRLNLVQSDVTVSFSPFFHTGGWNVLLTPFLHRGAKTVLLKKFCPEKVLAICEKEKVTILFGVPTTLDMMAQTDKFKTANLSSMRFAVVGGEAMPVDLIRTWQNKDIPVRQGYGLTEFGPNVFSLNEQDSIRKIGSVGFANFYIDIKVVDSNNQDLPQGEIGELCLRGPACTPGYWQNPEATAQTIQDGWLHTGDLVRQDDEGYFYIVGRKKEMFISGGENVYPIEIEQFLRKHPAISEVAVVGVPDEKWGEVGKAFIVADKAQNKNLMEESVRDYCLSGLAKFKTPKHFVFVEALPKGDSGKVLKRKLLE